MPKTLILRKMRHAIIGCIQRYLKSVHISYIFQPFATKMSVSAVKTRLENEWKELPTIKQEVMQSRNDQVATRNLSDKCK